MNDFSLHVYVLGGGGSLREQCVRCKAGHRAHKPSDFMVNQGLWFLYDHQAEQIKLTVSSEGWLFYPETDPQPSSLTPP